MENSSSIHMKIEHLFLAMSYHWTALVVYIISPIVSCKFIICKGQKVRNIVIAIFVPKKEKKIK